MSLEKEISRRGFVKLLGVTGLSWSLDREPLRCLEILNPQRLDGTIGVNGGHLLDSRFYRPGDSIRIPLNRRAFDPPGKIPEGTSQRSLDPFYLGGEKLRSFRLKGGKVTLVIEMDAIDQVDTPEHLFRMFSYANEFLNFGKRDRVIMGNEHNCRNYPIDIYIKQASELYRFIKRTNPEIEVGLEGEAWYGEGEYFRRLLGDFAERKFFPFDSVPINFYGRPEKLPERVALYQKIMREFGLNKPVLIGEMGVRISDDPEKEKLSSPGEIIVTPKEQADAVWKYFCFAKLSNCPAFWFCAQDDSENRQWPKYGLVDAEGTPRLGVEIMCRVQSLLDQAKVIKYERNKEFIEFRILTREAEIWISWSWRDKAVLGGPVGISINLNSRKFGLDIF